MKTNTLAFVAKLCLFLAFTICFCSLATAQTTTISGTINRYSKVTAIDIAQNSLTITEPTNFKVCDTVLLIQMQGAVIDQTNTASFGNITDYRSAGLYEKCIIDRINGSQVFLRHKLLNAYDAAAAVQLVTVPQFVDVNIASTLTGRAWDGNTGGVIAFEASGIVRITGLIDATSIGFRGGRANANAACNANATDFFYPTSQNIAGLKGEGIALVGATIASGKGNAANSGGGGACRNAGGGGGSNAGIGGAGGSTTRSTGEIREASGLGGRLLQYAANTARIFMGGGGGAGNQDDNTASNGGNGGGIVYIAGNQIVGGGLINASGASADQAGIDGAGGGGAGGTVLLQSFIRPLAVQVLARGGAGGNTNGIGTGSPSTDCFAPGGGGGGGAFFTNGSATGISLSIDGGTAGRIVSSLSACANTNYGATNGSLGQSLSSTNLMPIGTTEQSPLTVTVVSLTAPACANAQLVLNVTNPIAGASYLWQQNGVDMAGQTGTALTVSTSGVYRVRVSLGCNFIFSAEQVVTINGQPIAVIAGNSPQTVCGGGNSVTLTATQSPLFTYQWRRDGTAIAGATNATFSANTAGVYTVAVTACTNTVISNAITLVNPTVVTPVVSGSNLLCTGGSTRLSASPFNANYQWRLNGVNIIGATGSTYEATQVGDYTVIDPRTCNPNPSSSFIIQAATTPATIAITGNLQACQGNSARLTATSGAGFTYQWFRNGQAIANAVANPYQATQAGSYTVQVNDACNRVLTSPAVNVTIITAPDNLFVRGQALLCQGTAPLTVRFVRTYRYQWLLNGADIAGATDTAYVATATGVYGVNVKDTCNNEYFTPAFLVSSGSLDQIQISINGSRRILCPGDRITLTANSTGFGLSLQWQLNGQDIPSATGNAYIATQAGSYTVRTFNSCTSRSSAPYVIAAGTPPPATITGNFSFCFGERTNLTAPSGQNFSYQWIRNDTLINGGITASIPVFVGGSYKVAVTNGDGCRTISEPVVVVANRFDEAAAKVSSNTNLVCAGTGARLTATGGVRYEWTPTTGLNNAFIANPIATPSVSTTYTVKIINNFGCSSTRSITIEVIPEFTLDFDLVLNGDCGQRQLISIVNKSKGLNGFNDITWSMGDGEVVRGFTPVPYTYAKGGSYTITLRIDNRGCVKTLSKRIEFENFFYPTVITPNEDGKNDAFVIDNPNEGWLFEVYDRYGRKVFESENYNNDWKGEKTAATYYYRLVAPSGKECRSWCYVVL